ncbi:uncharacterized protein J7T54_005136 [Emericellopsis cladophorae]|uniref:ATP-grasp domain-containing protein n=1 Tax=Emericellopsis cladophorae TaxID=2686198 RepID=A0A9Q0BEJ4_9HYPO|nr:uncharacterized protein J7T54_005136 [Emericellopsis cladophorae]KAI6781926.1 hypothetical protein J7T54_005136 [Emericellopsis cladophorae]
MLDFWRHRIKNLALLVLSLVFLPIDTLVILCIDVYSRLLGRKPSHNGARGKKTVLVTGVSMAKGLALARHFRRAGHRVIGADFHALSQGRVSSAIDKFYALPWPAAEEMPDDEDIEDDGYALALLKIVRENKVDIWVSNSDVSAAIQDGLARDMIESQTSAKAIQLSARHVRLLHEKDSFMTLCHKLGLPIPDTQIVSSRSDIIEFFANRGGLKLTPDASTRYLIKPIGVNDIARFDMPLLPLESEEETLRRLDSIPLGSGKFIVQEFIQGFEFCTHALVVRGKVRAFVSCPSSELLMHYKAMDPDTPLSNAMLEFTEKLAASLGETFTGHASFDFLVKAGEDKGEVVVYPIECNPRVHTAVVLFNDTPELVAEYLSVLHDTPSRGPPIVPRHPHKYYWLGQETVERLLYPLYRDFPALPHKTPEFRSFVEHVQHWKDGTFETWDPWPWWWLYHVYWPVQFARYLVWGRWHKVNVSTGKAFQAK